MVMEIFERTIALKPGKSRWIFQLSMTPGIPWGIVQGHPLVAQEGYEPGVGETHGLGEPGLGNHAFLAEAAVRLFVIPMDVAGAEVDVPVLLQKAHAGSPEIALELNLRIVCHLLRIRGHDLRESPVAPGGQRQAVVPPVCDLAARGSVLPDSSSFRPVKGSPPIL